MPEDGFHPEKVDDALEVLFCADGHGEDYGVGAQHVLHLADYLEEVSAGAVHLVDVADARHTVLVGLAPDGFRLWLYAAYCTVSGNGSVEHAQGTFHLGGEIDMARRVYQIEFILLAVVVPVGCGGSGGDCDASLLLLFHPVHSCAALVHLAYLVGLARVEEDTLGGCCLAGINMGHDTEVTRQM